MSKIVVGVAFLIYACFRLLFNKDNWIAPGEDSPETRSDDLEDARRLDRLRQSKLNRKLDR